MANRRMFSKTIIESARFLQLPADVQALYFHLGMRADDDGIVEAYTTIRLCEGSEALLEVLEYSGFTIRLNDMLVSYITDWNEHNSIRADRKIDSKYKDLLLDKVKNVKIIEPKERIENKTTYRKEAMDNSDLPYSFTYKIRQAFFGEKCPLCGLEMSGETNKASIQHNMPISKGGKHELDNISVICHRCNVSKRDTPTGDLNCQEVKIAWEKINGPPNDRPMPAQVRLVEVRLDKKREPKKETINSDAFAPSIIALFNSIAGKSVMITNPTYIKKINSIIKDLKKLGIKTDEEQLKKFRYVFTNQKKINDDPDHFWNHYKIGTLLANSNFFDYMDADRYNIKQEVERPRGREIR